ncbi:TetR/AcrR family transcriptional regulator [Solibacillus sp. FSL H8-0538]|uniref:TetR/AcrR family transcriptional regulator n=1 Tax=Solibacillus sp. FSL H8-0538 TaxID=2921400 RepID=UPI0030F959C6
MTKKQLIIDSAIELFAVRGIEATSVQQITEHCGISKGAFYLSFKSKDELILAMIDYFMKNIIEQIDQAVSHIKNPQEKLFLYYVSTFKVLERYAGFAELFIKEPVQTISEEFLEKVTFYENVSNKALLQLIDELYGELVEQTKYDLMIIIKGFIKSYAQVLYSLKKDFKLEELSKSLVEKTNILANHSKQTFVTETMVKMFSQTGTVTKEAILEEIEELESNLTDPVELDSLTVLAEQLQLATPRPAIVNGMLANLKQNQQCNWCCYLIKNYMDK